MFGISNYFEVLERIQNIKEDCSDCSEKEQSDSEVPEQSYDSIEIKEEFDFTGADSESENVHLTQKRPRLLIGPEIENDIKNQYTETAADGTVWHEIGEGPSRGQAPAFMKVSGPTTYAKNNIINGKVSSAFSLLIDRSVMQHIQTCTEAEALRVLGTDWKLTSDKLDAFIGLLYARAAYEANSLNISYLWSKKWGPSFFSRTMGRNTFTEIMRFIRFDDRNQRSQRLQTDKFALISEIWNKFIVNSQNCFNPGSYVTIDEQLLPTKAKCRFTQYVAHKPDKLGIKFWLASDVKTKYIVNGLPYLGKDEDKDSAVPIGESVVLKLMEPFTGCGRNLTTDHFFTSLSLAKKLLEKETTIVGMIHGSKKELPKSAKQTEDGMPRFSTKLYRSNECTLTVYKNKPNKKVLILSSLHQSVSIEKSDKGVPETVKLYNSTKFAGDMIDQMTKKYTVKSKSRRWPLQVFFNILDLAGINAWILYREVTGEKISRQEFLFQLAEELAEEFQLAQERIQEQEDIPETSKSVRKSCQIRFCKKNKTTNICFKCKKYVCGTCAVPICKKCVYKDK